MIFCDIHSCFCPHSVLFLHSNRQQAVCFKASGEAWIEGKQKLARFLGFCFLKAQDQREGRVGGWRREKRVCRSRQVRGTSSHMQRQALQAVSVQSKVGGLCESSPASSTCNHIVLD